MWWGNGTNVSNVDYKIDSKVSEIEKADLPKGLADTIKDGNYRTVTTKEAVILYRVFRERMIC